MSSRRRENPRYDAVRSPRRPEAVTRRTLPKSSYREYLQRCEFVGREPEDFVTYLAHARRWRTEYGPAVDRGDFDLIRELEDLLCV